MSKGNQIKERKPISKKVRFEVFKRDSFTCQYCGSKSPDVILEIDHIKPVVMGGDNDILNLITSCFDCNRGKGKKEISDKSIVSQQVDQLAQLNERRVQLDMLLDWKKGLLDIDKEVTQKIADYFEELTGYSINEIGLTRLKAIIKKYSPEKTIIAMERAVEVYFKNDIDTVEITFNKIGAICNLNEKPDYSRKISYIMGILRNKSIFFNNKKMGASLMHHYENGVDLDEITEITKSVSGWKDFKSKFTELQIEF